MTGLKTPLRLIAFIAALFWLAAQLGFVFSDAGYLTPVWPPAAVACAAALLFGMPSLLGAAAYIFVDYAIYGPGGWAEHLPRVPRSLVEPAAMLITAFLLRRLAGWVRFDVRLTSAERRPDHLRLLRDLPHHALPAERLARALGAGLRG
jgi:hypothetical protein